MADGAEEAGAAPSAAGLPEGTPLPSLAEVVAEMRGKEPAMQQRLGVEAARQLQDAAGEALELCQGFDPGTDGVALAFLLAAYGKHLGAAAPPADEGARTAFLNAAAQVVAGIPREQVKLAPKPFAALCRALKEQVLAEAGGPSFGAAVAALKSLMTAIEKVRQGPEHLTPQHVDFVQLCLLAKLYHVAAPVLDEDIYQGWPPTCRGGPRHDTPTCRGVGANPDIYDVNPMQHQKAQPPHQAPARSARFGPPPPARTAARAAARALLTSAGPPVLEFEGAGGETPKAKGRRTVPCVLGSVALPIGAADAFRILRDRGEIFGSVEKFERRERVDLGEGRASDLAHSIMRWRVGPATGTFEQRLRRIHDACDRRLYFALDPAFKKTSMWERFDGCWQVVDRPGDHGGGCAVFLVQYMKLGGLAFPGIKKAMAWIVNGILKDLHAEAARLAAGPAAGPASHALADE